MNVLKSTTMDNELQAQKKVPGLKVLVQCFVCQPLRNVLFNQRPGACFAQQPNLAGKRVYFEGLIF